MTRKEAKETAAARGFPSVSAWMRENRKAWKQFNSRASMKNENRERLQTLMQRLDHEFQTYKNLA
jgi:hypothetical protein